MTVECFIDTNVLVYAAAGRGPLEEKRRRSLELMDRENFGLSAQVLQEFYVTVVRKIEHALSPADAMAWVETLASFPCIAVDSGLVKIAAVNSVRYRISYWDAAVLAAAEAMGARTLYSEDLNSGQLYGDVRVVNPFA